MIRVDVVDQSLVLLFLNPLCSVVVCQSVGDSLLVGRWLTNLTCSHTNVADVGLFVNCCVDNDEVVPLSSSTQPVTKTTNINDESDSTDRRVMVIDWSSWLLFVVGDVNDNDSRCQSWWREVWMMMNWMPFLSFATLSSTRLTLSHFCWHNNDNQWR